jgi:hypothetical protein
MRTGIRQKMRRDHPRSENSYMLVVARRVTSWRLKLFNAFAYSEKKRQYVTSWRVDNEPSRRDPDSIGHSFPLLLVAVSSSILGFASQFVGLRGLHGSIALYQLASTLCMAVVRALLRSRRLNWEANTLKDLKRDVEGHELDWRALNLESGKR